MMSVRAFLSSWFMPRFLFTERVSLRPPGFLSYSRLWMLSIIVLATVSLVPLSILTLVDYQLTERAIQSEHVLRTTRITSNTRRTLSSFLNERLDALLFTVQEESFSQLKNPTHLAQVLRNLKVGFGGFADLGLIDESGRQIAYIGPFDLEGKDYSGQSWFRSVMKEGLHVSDVFLGFREEPHISVTARSPVKNGSFFILRGTLDFKRLAGILESLEIGESGDAFLINHKGTLQTDSSFFGEMLEGRMRPVPPYSEHTSHFDTRVQGKDMLLSYAYIQNSPFILCIAKAKSEAMKVWFDLRTNQMWLFFTSIAAILTVIYLISTAMMNAIHDANVKQTHAMEQMEHSSRLASVGRLAAGVAHEVNNPLAVVSERAGLVRDMLELPPEKRSEQRIIENIDIVLDAVDRCGKITRQLLNFSRKMDVEVEKFSVPQVIDEVLSFLEKEAGYRNISIREEHQPDMPDIISDRGKVQQIVLNLVNNAFQAMPEGGALAIETFMENEHVNIRVADTGAGISEENLKRIFEPFFTTRRKSGGSGLGLSITYGLARKLGGDISVVSEDGAGTSFTVTLPLEIEEEV
jgi:signal transduction histidine kinase